MERKSYVVSIYKKDTIELVDVVYVEAMSEKGVSKLLKNDFKGCSFYPKEFEMKNKESLLRGDW